MRRPSDRDLLIAVNAHPLLPRSAVCCLADGLEVWRAAAPDAALAARLGVPARHLEQAMDWRSRAGAVAAAEQRAAARLGGTVLTVLDGDYPPPLRELALPPPVLYVHGALPDDRGIAIVGSRAASPYALEVAGHFGRVLAAAGEPIVSGLARGVDAAAHRGALGATGGVTVAVLGCGLETQYPRAHLALRDEIAARGAVVSEYPVAAQPLARHFPVRNRIIAALARGVLVIEAAARSGSLSTARHALDLGREVWAIPGRIFDEGAVGTNALIQDGAMLVRDPRDLLPDDLSLPYPPSQGTAVGPRPTGVGASILGALVPGDPRPVEDVARRAGVALDAALTALLELELDGRARRHPGPAYDRPAGPLECVRDASVLGIASSPARGASGRRGGGC